MSFRQGALVLIDASVLLLIVAQEPAGAAHTANFPFRKIVSNEEKLAAERGCDLVRDFFNESQPRSQFGLSYCRSLAARAARLYLLSPEHLPPKPATSALVWPRPLRGPPSESV